VLSLPAGSTPIDFAYAVHTEVGHRTVGSRVNQRLVPLEYHLNNGDQVEVLTSKSPNAGPSRDWLNFVASPRARTKIRQYFMRERREESIEQGKESLAKQLRRTGLPVHRLLSAEHVAALARHFRVADVTALYAAIGEGSVSAQSVVERLIAAEGGAEEAAEASVEDHAAITSTQRRRPTRRSNDVGVTVEGHSDLRVKLAKCCMPVPGDEIIGFITREDGVSVHRADCTNADNLRGKPERLVEVSWATPSADSSFLVAVHVEGLDRAGLLSDVSRVMTEHHSNILSMSANTNKDRVFTMRLQFETPDPTHLASLTNALKRIPGVYEAHRVKS
jgi:GTP pyrophosphokinase